MPIPSLRFKDKEGGNFPDWTTKTLGEVGIVKMGQSPDSKSYNQSGEGMMLIQGNADISNRISSPRQWTNKPTKKCEIGDLILTVRAPVGVIAKSQHNACIGRGVCSISDKKSSSNEFLYQFLLQYEDKWVRLEQGSTFTAVSGKDIKGVKLNLPVIEEQQKIASFLSSVDDKINLLTKKKELLEQYKKGVMQKIFSQEIRFKDDNGNDFPDWEEKKLVYLCDISTGKLDANEMNDKGNYRFYTCAKDYYHIDSYAFDTNALIISGNGANVGYIHHYEGKFNAYQRTYVLDNFKDDIIFVKFFLEKHLYRRIYREKKDGATPYITLSTLTDMNISIPQLNEQIKISSFLSLIDKKIILVDSQIDKTKEFKKGLLQQMFV